MQGCSMDICASVAIGLAPTARLMTLNAIVYVLVIRQDIVVLSGIILSFL